MHAWALDEARYPFADPFPGAKPPALANTTEEVLEVMDRHGVDFTVLVQVRYYGWDNRYLADSLRRYPGRFAAQGLLDPHDPQSPRKLAALVREQGFRGIRLSPAYHPDDPWLNRPDQHPLWREAEALGAVFNFLIRPPQLRQLADMAERFPGVKVVVDHMGYPDVAAGPPHDLLALARLPNVFVKVTEFYSHSLTRLFPYEDVLPTVRAVYDAFGPRRLLWGTGFTRGELWGRIPYAQELELIREHVPFFTEEEKEWILGRTAMSIWRL